MQSPWLFNYVHDPSRVRMRPWLTVRMPTFDFTDDQPNTVIGYFASREQRRPFGSEPPGADARNLAVGEVVFNMFQCAKCHPAGADAAHAAGGAKGDLAPSLLLAHDRLRYDWVPSVGQEPAVLDSWHPHAVELPGDRARQVRCRRSPRRSTRPPTRPRSRR